MFARERDGACVCQASWKWHFNPTETVCVCVWGIYWHGSGVAGSLCCTRSLLNPWFTVRSVGLACPCRTSLWIFYEVLYYMATATVLQLWAEYWGRKNKKQRSARAWTSSHLCRVMMGDKMSQGGRSLAAFSSEWKCGPDSLSMLTGVPVWFLLAAAAWKGWARSKRWAVGRSLEQRGCHHRGWWTPRAVSAPGFNQSRGGRAFRR